MRKRKKKRVVENQSFLPDIVYVSDVLTSAGVTASSQRVGWQISRHNIPDVWLETQGEDITVAVIDTGTNPNHPDLAGSISKSWNVFDFQETANDGNGHGSHVTGIITANNNSIGMVGVAPKANIIAIKVLSDDGSGSTAGVVAGIRYAIQNKADIISMSLGGPNPDPGLHAACKEAYDLNIPVICAAGNSGNRGIISYPARYPETISIGALNDQNLRAEFSQTGVKLDFMAPGVDIFSTYLGGYRVLSGTSMATPWVAGVVALMMAKHRKIGGKTPLNTIEEIREHLQKTAIDLNSAGKDSLTGFGLVDVTKALAKIQQSEGDSTMPNFDELTTQFNAWVKKYTDTVTTRDQIQQQITDLQSQLDAKTTEVTAYESKATQISQLLG